MRWKSAQKSIFSQVNISVIYGEGVTMKREGCKVWKKTPLRVSLSKTPLLSLVSIVEQKNVDENAKNV